jgi:NAD-dependent deacetylase
MADLLQQAVDLLQAAQSILVFTGAGMSKESGIPTYREPLTGVWENVDPILMATQFGYLEQPEKAWQWHVYFRTLIANSEPNAGHRALAQWQSHSSKLNMLTQNIDDLHERAGSTGVIHLHGSIFTHKCFQDCQGTPTMLRLSELRDEREPPHCPHCDGFVRPAVVWYGDQLDPLNVRAMRAFVEQADVVLCVGLSGAITYQIPQKIRQKGGKVIEINPNASAITEVVDVWLQDTAAHALPHLVEHLYSI